MQATESGQCLKVYLVSAGYINVLSPIQRIGSPSKADTSSRTSTRESLPKVSLDGNSQTASFRSFPFVFLAR